MPRVAALLLALSIALHGAGLGVAMNAPGAGAGDWTQASAIGLAGPELTQNRVRRCSSVSSLQAINGVSLCFAAHLSETLSITGPGAARGAYERSEAMRLRGRFLQPDHDPPKHLS